MTGIGRFGGFSLRPRCLSVLCALALVALAGCRAPEVTEINNRLTSPDIITKKPPNADYIVEPPDVVRVVIIGEPDLTQEAQVRQDGYITFPHIPDQKVVGLTTVEIEELLAEAYSDLVRGPEVHVTVTSYRSKHVYVYGEVGRRGSLPYTGTQTIADVIGSVGGVTRRSAPRRARVIRGDISEPEVFMVDLYALYLKGDRRQDVSLSEDDVVYVPPNVFAWVGYQVDNILFPFRGILGLGGAVLSAEALADTFD